MAPAILLLCMVVVIAMRLRKVTVEVHIRTWSTNLARMWYRAVVTVKLDPVDVQICWGGRCAAVQVYVPNWIVLQLNMIRWRI